MDGVLRPSDRRLSAIVQLVPPCGCAADVGTDHGKIGAQLLLSGKCSRVIFSDISALSLEKAKKLVDDKGLHDKAEFCIADGLEGLPCPLDSIVIAGMGGLNIRDIIVKGKNAAMNAVLVLQPNTEIEALRRALCENRFRITDEKIAREGKRFYVIIRAEKGQMRLDETELLAGPVLLKSSDSEVKAYYVKMYETAEKLVRQIEMSGTERNLKEHKREMDIWKTALSV